jgi:hypothetical protein
VVGSDDAYSNRSASIRKRTDHGADAHHHAEHREDAPHAVSRQGLAAITKIIKGCMRTARQQERDSTDVQP